MDARNHGGKPSPFEEARELRAAPHTAAAIDRTDVRADRLHRDAESRGQPRQRFATHDGLRDVPLARRKQRLHRRRSGSLRGVVDEPSEEPLRLPALDGRSPFDAATDPALRERLVAAFGRYEKQCLAFERLALEIGLTREEAAAAHARFGTQFRRAPETLVDPTLRLDQVRARLGIASEDD